MPYTFGPIHHFVGIDVALHEQRCTSLGWNLSTARIRVADHQSDRSLWCCRPRRIGTRLDRRIQGGRPLGMPRSSRAPAGAVVVSRSLLISWRSHDRSNAAHELPRQPSCLTQETPSKRGDRNAVRSPSQIGSTLLQVGRRFTERGVSRRMFRKAARQRWCERVVAFGLRRL